MFTVSEDKTHVFVKYSCGKAGRTIDVHLHGVNVAVQNLVDDYEKHVYGLDQKGKDACSSCKTHKSLNSMSEEITKFATAMKDLRESAITMRMGLDK